MTASDQFKRRCELVVSAGEAGLDLSAFHIQFEIAAGDTETPNSAFVRIFNLSDATSRRVQEEFSFVTLSAGYVDGNFATIFRGTIKEVRRGRLSATDTFTDVFAADGDTNYVFGFVNQAFAAGATQVDQLNAYAAALGRPTSGINVRYAPGVVTAPAVPLPRGKVAFGMARARLRNLAAWQEWNWSIQDGALQVTPFTGYQPGEAVVLTSKTGMIGMPTQTNGGVIARCLLNPKVKVGDLVQIDNKSIIPAQISLQTGAINQFASIAADGLYRAYVVENQGDTRGNPWYTDLTCLAVNPTVAPASSVAAYG